MVKVEIVEEDTGNSPYSSASSSRTGSSDSLSSASDTDEFKPETLVDRLAALVDIVPPQTRHSISTRVARTADVVKRTTKVLGNVIWVLTTSALLVALPLALALEDEAKIVQQEREMHEQQQGVQQMLAPSSPYGAQPQGAGSGKPAQGLVPPGF